MNHRFSVLKRAAVLLAFALALLAGGCIKQRHAIVPPPPEPSVDLGTR